MRGMRQFRKKALMVEAKRLDKVTKVETPEGTMTGNPGDWLMRGVEKELYLCKDSIFRKTFIPVDDLARDEWDRVISHPSIEPVNPVIIRDMNPEWQGVNIAGQFKHQDMIPDVWEMSGGYAVFQEKVAEYSKKKMQLMEEMIVNFANKFDVGPDQMVIREKQTVEGMVFWPDLKGPDCYFMVPIIDRDGIRQGLADVMEAIEGFDWPEAQKRLEMLQEIVEQPEPPEVE